MNNTLSDTTDVHSQFMATWNTLAEALGEIGLTFGIPLPPRVITVADKLLDDGHIDSADRGAIVTLWDARNLYLHGGYDPGEDQMIANLDTANGLITQLTPVKDALVSASGA